MLYRQNTTPQNEKIFAQFHAARGAVFMQTGQFQRAFYDYSSAVRLDDSTAKYFGFYTYIYICLHTLIYI